MNKHCNLCKYYFNEKRPNRYNQHCTYFLVGIIASVKNPFQKVNYKGELTWEDNFDDIKQVLKEEDGIKIETIKDIHKIAKTCELNKNLECSHFDRDWGRGKLTGWRLVVASIFNPLP